MSSISNNFKFKNVRRNGKFVKLSINEKIRQLHQVEGASYADIAKHLGTKYQRVRNVLGAQESCKAIVRVA